MSSMTDSQMIAAYREDNSELRRKCRALESEVTRLRSQRDAAAAVACDMASDEPRCWPDNAPKEVRLAIGGVDPDEARRLGSIVFGETEETADAD